MEESIGKGNDNMGVGFLVLDGMLVRYVGVEYCTELG